MKNILTPIAIAALLLTGCSDSSTPATSTHSPTVKVDSATMPDVTGKNYGEAAAALEALRIDYRAVGPDGITYITRPDDTAKVTSINFEAGAQVAKATPAILTMELTESQVVEAMVQSAAAKNLETRYDIKCSTTSSVYTDEDARSVHATADVWKDKDFNKFQTCNVEIAGESVLGTVEPIALIPAEQDVVDFIAKNGGDVSVPASAFADVLEACAIAPKLNWERSLGSGNSRVQAIAKAAVRMCADAPFASELQRIADGTPPATMDDGKYVVGKLIQAGTYQIQIPEGANGISNCYWERTYGTGGTIQNDFITFAPQGPAVTLYDGEGFVSERCGIWKKIG